MSPTYIYKCDRCQATAEAVHSITKSPKVTCPKCKKSMRRVITGGAGVIFKGEGWPGQDIKREKEK